LRRLYYSSLLCEEKTGKPRPLEILGAGRSLGWVSAVDSRGRTIWIVDAHRDNGKRFVARADEKLTAFLEPESPIRAVSP
jgi:hypothetical protein